MGNRYPGRFKLFLEEPQMKTIIEVGANDGRDTQRFLADEQNQVYAFEPTPELIVHLQSNFKNRENFSLIPAAVDTANSFKWFNVAGQGDWGCSSLYEFTPDIHSKWEGRPDFKFTNRYKVMTIRLDTFIEQYGIGEIDYLWIDAQGNDFNVLCSLGDKIRMVKEGKCEGSYTVELYQNTNNHVNTISAWLETQGFSCTIVPDSLGKEADLHFKRV